MSLLGVNSICGFKQHPSITYKVDSFLGLIIFKWKKKSVENSSAQPTPQFMFRMKYPGLTHCK